MHACPQCGRPAAGARWGTGLGRCLWGIYRHAAGRGDTGVKGAGMALIWRQRAQGVLRCTVLQTVDNLQGGPLGTRSPAERAKMPPICTHTVTHHRTT